MSDECNKAIIYQICYAIKMIPYFLLYQFVYHIFKIIISTILLNQIIYFVIMVPHFPQKKKKKTVNNEGGVCKLYRQQWPVSVYFCILSLILFEIGITKNWKQRRYSAIVQRITMLTTKKICRSLRLVFLFQVL